MRGGHETARSLSAGTLEPGVDPPTLRRHGTQVVAAVALGGALGAAARHGLGLILPVQDGDVPWATLLANGAGCLLIGVLMVVVTEAVRPHRLARPFLGVGVLGGFTTFSTSMVETQGLLVDGRPGIALGYLMGTLVLALTAVLLGVLATRLLLRVTRPGDDETRST